MLLSSIWSLAVDTLPLALFFDGCFSIVAVWTDALPPHRFRCLPSSAEGVMAPLDTWRMLCRRGCSDGCLAAMVLAVVDALSPWSRLFLVDALPPRLRLLCWQRCNDVYFFLVGPVG
jgi:hypothetical protein